MKVQTIQFRPIGALHPVAITADAAIQAIPALLKPLAWRVLYEDEKARYDDAGSLAGSYRVVQDKEHDFWIASHAGIYQLKNQFGQYKMSEEGARQACETHRAARMQEEFEADDTPRLPTEEEARYAAHVLLQCKNTDLEKWTDDLWTTHWSEEALRNIVQATHQMEKNLHD